MLDEGIIIKVNTDTFTVSTNDLKFDCKTRGKLRNNNIKPVVGDIVIYDKEKLMIEDVQERKNVLDRPLVANVDMALIVTSIKKPEISLSLLDKMISIITINHIEPVIVFSKLDLANKKDLENLKLIRKYYQKIGIKNFTNKNIFGLKRYLKNKIVVLCGQTGAGKSSLINKLDKKLNLETKEISEALGRGVHTTRIVSLYKIKNFYVVDTPGFSQIDLNNYSLEEIKKSFREFNNYQCKFKDCKHLNENNCEVIKNVDKKIMKSRYDNYVRFIKEII